MFVVGGESLIDLVEERRDTGDTVWLSAHAGGSPYNCAIALARLGNRAGFLCPISRDGFGTRLLRPLEEAGVVPLLGERVSEPTSLAVVTLNEKMEARYEFYRSADRAFTAEGLVAALPAETELFQVGGFCAIEPTDAEAWLAVADAALARGATLSMDPNVRPSLVADFAAYRARLERFFERTHVAKLSIEDLVALENGAMDAALSPDARETLVARWVEYLLSRPNCQLVVVTFGDEGSRAFTRTGSVRAGVHRPSVFGDTVGAGDSLMAGILTFLAEAGALAPGRLGALGEPDLAAMLRFGAVVAGLNCAHVGCRPPARAEVEAVLAAT